MAGKEGYARGLSFRQARAVDFRIRYPYKSKAWVIKQAGYGKFMGRQPQKVFGSPAFQAELERRGFVSPRPLSNEMSKPNERNADEFVRDTAPFAPVKLTEEQLICLKEMLEVIPNPTPHYQPVQKKETRPYDPRDGGLDPNTGEPPKCNMAEIDMSRMSSM